MLSNKEKLRKIFKKSLSVFKVEPFLSLNEHANRWFTLAKGSSSISGRWRSLSYQVEMLNILGNDDVKVVTCVKSSRVGWTKIILAMVNYYLSQYRKSIAIFSPTAGESDDFVKREVDPFIRESKSLSKIAPWIGKRSSDNTLKMKSFIGCYLHLKGGNSPIAYMGITVDIVVFEEAARFPANVGNEGSPFELGSVRIQTSSLGRLIIGSSPRLKGSCLVTESMESADVRLQRYLPCPHCNELQPLVWGGENAKYGLTFTDNDENTARYICYSCHEPFFYTNLREIDKKGVWKNNDEISVKDGDFYKEGVRIDPPYHVGLFIWSAYSYYTSWKETVKVFILAKKQVLLGNDNPMITFFNTRLGLAYQKEEKDEIDVDMLWRRRENYSADCIPNRITYITCGVDTQDDRFEMIFIGWAKDEESFVLGYDKLYGTLSKSVVWEALSERIRRKFKKENGEQLEVNRVCIDSAGHYTMEVYNFSRDNGTNFVIPIFGSNKHDSDFIEFPRVRRKTGNSKGTYLTKIGTQSGKEVIYNRLAMQSDFDISVPVGGYIHFPRTDENINKEFFKELTCEKRQFVYKDGQKYIDFIKPSGARNEPLDTFNYAYACLKISTEKFGVNIENYKKQTPSKPKQSRMGYND